MNTNPTFKEPISYIVDSDDKLSPSASDTLANDGVVCIRQAINQSWLDVIEQGIELALNGASTNVDIVKRKGDTGSFSFSSGAWPQVEPFKRFIFESPMADIAWTLFQSKKLTLFYDFLLIKQAHSDSAATPWHQDHSYYPLDGQQVMNCWVALDDIPIESALRFIKGSHLPNELFRAIDFENPSKDYQHARKELPLPPSTDASDKTTRSTEILTTSLKAGDMLAWTSYTLHSADGNKLDRRRAAFSVNWLGDNVVFNGQDSLATYRDPSQIIGKPLNCDKFPIVRGNTD